MKSDELEEAKRLLVEIERADSARTYAGHGPTPSEVIHNALLDKEIAALEFAIKAYDYEEGILDYASLKNRLSELKKQREEMVRV